MPDLLVSNDTEIIAKVHKTAEISMIFKVHTYDSSLVGVFVHAFRDIPLSR